jgi:hypothetical protein
MAGAIHPALHLQRIAQEIVHMFSKTKATAAALTCALVAGTFTLGQILPGGSGGSGGIGGNGIDNGVILSRVRLFNFDNGVARLDTSTGSLSLFRGDLTGRNARGTWQSFARPVSSGNSRFFDLQVVNNAVFLVDAIRGDTWILRDRGNIAGWDPVRISGSTTSD